LEKKALKREIKITEDGSKTLYIKELDECYHSHFGALQEAEHVFIKYGLNLINKNEINILELGFGTGLNVLVTINEYLKTNKNHVINYYSLEKYPINLLEVEQLCYSSLFCEQNLTSIGQKIHTVEWEQLQEIVPGFHLKKIKCDFFELKNQVLPPIDLVYFDCFGANAQPDLWEKPLFEMVCNTMNNDALLTTYSCKGSVKRILKELDMRIEKKPGPPGKREMLNAWK
jgi:tRNA U34 5-methylaminomethyl-2-thiouridine-forming methyltransferase MnmC